jgi:hypothetical protein
MGGPRHLWSGDWRHESSSHAEDLATRRTTSAEEPAEPTRLAPPPRRPVAPRPPRRTWRARLRSLDPDRQRRLRAAGTILSLALLSAGGAYVVTALVVRVMGGV